MRFKALTVSLSAFLLISGSSRVYSGEQEANVLFGGLTTDKGGRSWAFEVEYKQLDLATYKDLGFDGSFAYLNEGHPTGPYRDGVTVQGWARLFDGSKVHVSLGAGPCLYNEAIPHRPEANGLGLVTSFDIKYDAWKEFSVGAPQRNRGSHRAE